MIPGLEALEPLDAKTQAAVVSVVAKSACLKTDWKDRGPAPRGYIEGMASVYAQHICNKPKGQSISGVIGQDIAPNSKTDALAIYGIKPTSFETHLRKLLTLQIGLGMRESTGNTTEGRDTTVKNPTADNAEAGLFQTSFDSFYVSPWFGLMQTYYQAKPEACLLPLFSHGITDHKAPIVGTGPGAAYQAFTKQCPAFAVNSAAIMLRLEGTHFGPVVRKEAQVLQQCEAMLKELEKVCP